MNIQFMNQQMRSYIFLKKTILQQSYRCSKQNKMEDQSKFEDMYI
jgi:hypothetical protein